MISLGLPLQAIAKFGRTSPVVKSLQAFLAFVEFLTERDKVGAGNLQSCQPVVDQDSKTTERNERSMYMLSYNIMDQ